MSKQMQIRLMLAFFIVIFLGISLVMMIARGGSLSGVMGIRNFTLCQAGYAGGTPRPLASLILSPTTVVYACGYLDVSLSYPGDLCFYYLSGSKTSLTVLSRKGLKTSLTVFEACSIS
jgi:hypothetical protein